MLDRFEFWHAAAAVGIVLLLRHQPGLRARLGRGGFALLLAGALLPLGEYLAGALFAPDSIEFLVRPRWLHSLATGGTVIAAGMLLAAFGFGSRRALAGALLVAGGWAIHLALDALTPAGIWLGDSGHASSVGVPAFAEGHFLLIGLLVPALALLRLRPAWGRIVRIGAWSLVAVYIIGGLVQFGIAGAQAAALAGPGETWALEPADPWRAAWRVVLSAEGTHRVALLGPFGTVRAEPSPVPRWNDEPRLLALLADPVVRRFYYQVFRHPVTQVDETPVQLTLTMREAADLDAGQAGATFTFEMDPDGRERVYHVERFD